MMPCKTDKTNQQKKKKKKDFYFLSVELQDFKRRGGEMARKPVCCRECVMCSTQWG